MDVVECVRGGACEHVGLYGGVSATMCVQRSSCAYVRGYVYACAPNAACLDIVTPATISV